MAPRMIWAAVGSCAERSVGGVGVSSVLALQSGIVGRVERLPWFLRMLRCRSSRSRGETDDGVPASAAAAAADADAPDPRRGMMGCSLALFADDGGGGWDCGWGGGASSAGNGGRSNVEGMGMGRGCVC